MSAAEQQLPEDHVFRQRAGYVFHKQRRYGEAARSFRAALAFHTPEHPLTDATRARLFFELGEVLHFSERHVAAEESLRRAVALGPDAARSWLLLGQALWEQGRRDDAVAPLQRYLELSEGDASARETRARVSDELEKLRKSAQRSPQPARGMPLA